MAVFCDLWRKKLEKMNTQKILGKPFWIKIILLLCVAAVGLCLQLSLTRPWGIGLTPDSASYISAARGLLAGKGFTNPSEQEGPYSSYGPLYPIAIAMVGFFSGGASFGCARLLQGFLFAGNIFLVGFVTLKSARSFSPALAGSLIALTSLVSLEMHTRLISEPLYIFLLLLGFYRLSLFLREPDQKKLFWSACFFLSCAFLCRYAAIAIVPAGWAGLLLLNRGSAKVRIRQSVVFVFAVSFPMFVWVVRNRLVAGGEHFLWVYTPYWKTTLWELFAHISTWILPVETPRVVRITGLFLFFLFVLWAAVRAGIFRGKTMSSQGGGLRDTGYFFSRLAVLYCASHIMVEFYSTSFLAPMMFDNRHLSPVFFLMIPPLCWLLSTKVSNSDTHGGKDKLFHALVLCLIISYTVRAGFWAGDALKSGFAYASPRWKNSATLKRISSIPRTTPIYTNVVDAFYLLLDRPALPVPSKARGRDVASGIALSPSLSLTGFELQRLRLDLDTRDALIVYLNGVNWRAYYPTAEELTQGLGLEVLERFSDGVILKKKSPIVKSQLSR